MKLAPTFAALTLLLSACATEETTTPTPTENPGPPTDTAKPLLDDETTTTTAITTVPSNETTEEASNLVDKISALTIQPHHEGGYDRDLFSHWSDADGNGCDTREEVLITESTTPAQIDPYGCKVLTGDWTSRYDGVTTTDPSTFDVDHLVPLAEAWASGAHNWNTDRRESFANDLDHPDALIAVTAASNRTKGASDPSEWLPVDTNTWCWYANAWVDVKLKWELAADEPEVAALIDIADSCDGTTSTPAPGPQPTVPTPTETTAPTTPTDAGEECDPNYQTSGGPCVPHASSGDIDCGDLSSEQKPVTVIGGSDPHHLDGDSNGTGC